MMQILQHQIIIHLKMQLQQPIELLLSLNLFQEKIQMKLFLIELHTVAR